MANPTTKVEIGIPLRGKLGWSPLLDYQRKFLQQRAKIKIAQWGRGCGKSTIILLATIQRCLQYPGVRWLYLAPAYKVLTDALYPIIDDINSTYQELYGHSLIVKFTRSTQTNKMTLIGGSTITFRSGNRIDDLRGGSYGGISIEEAGYVEGSSASWAAFIPCLRGFAPLEVLVGGTPGGNTGVLAVLLEHAQKHPDECLVSRAYTYQNPHIPKEQIELLRNTLSAEMWAQEVMGEVVGRTGLVYPEYSDEKHIIPWDRRTELNKAGVETFAVIDWGYAQAYGLLLAVSRLPDGRPKVVIYYEHPFDRTDEMRICEQLFLESKKDPRPIRAVITDPEGFSGNRTAARFFSPYGISTIYERNPAKRRITDTIEFVRRGLANAAGEPSLYISKECASLPCNLPGGKGTVQAFKNYVLGQIDRVSGTVGNKPLDDNKHTHSMDAVRYFYINMHKFGYTWPTTQFDQQNYKSNNFWG